MTMPASGALNLSGTSTPISANWEAYSATGAIGMDDARLRTLAGVGGSGTGYGMASYYGKSWLVPMATYDAFTPWTSTFYEIVSYANYTSGYGNPRGPYGYTAVAGFYDYASVNGSAVYQLPGSAWSPHYYPIYNNNSRPQVVNVTVVSYMGMCGQGYADTYRSSPSQVLLGSNFLNTPADNSIYESTATYTDTIPAYTTHTYGVYYRSTFYHGVDRDLFGFGFRRITISFNSWG